MQRVLDVIEHVDGGSPCRLATVQLARVNRIASGVGPGVVLFHVLETDHGFSAVDEKFSEIGKYFKVITKQRYHRT